MHCPYCSADLGAGVVETGEPTKGQLRSREQHGRWFAMISIVYEQWPEAYAEFQPTSVEHLRKWVTTKCGFVDRIDVVPPPEMAFADSPEAQKAAMAWMVMIIANIRRNLEYSWLVRHKGGFQVIIPKSVAFDKMKQRDFNNLSSRTETLLEEIGFDVRVIFSEADRRIARVKAAT